MLILRILFNDGFFLCNDRIILCFLVKFIVFCKILVFVKGILLFENLVVLVFNSFLKLIKFLLFRDLVIVVIVLILIVFFVVFFLICFIIFGLEIVGLVLVIIRIVVKLFVVVDKVFVWIFFLCVCLGL